jgi:hypothetical protein
MYIMAQPRKPWTIASARQNLPALIRSAAREPQRVYRRNKLVATVVSPELSDKLVGEPSLADRFAELRRICAEENYELVIPPRRDRANPFVSRRSRKR